MATKYKNKRKKAWWPRASTASMWTLYYKLCCDLCLCEIIAEEAVLLFFCWTKYLHASWWCQMQSICAALCLVHTRMLMISGEGSVVWWLQAQASWVRPLTGYMLLKKLFSKMLTSISSQTCEYPWHNVVRAPGT